MSLIYSKAKAATFGYPDVNFEYAIVNPSQSNANTAQAIKALLAWGMDPTGGAKPSFLTPLYFLPLPSNALVVAINLLKQITAKSPSQPQAQRELSDEIVVTDTPNGPPAASRPGSGPDGELAVDRAPVSLGGDSQAVASRARNQRIGNHLLVHGSRIGAIIPLIALLGMIATLLVEAIPAIRYNGFGFFTSSVWEGGNPYGTAGPTPVASTTSPERISARGRSSRGRSSPRRSP